MFGFTKKTLKKTPIKLNPRIYEVYKCRCMLCGVEFEVPFDTGGLGHNIFPHSDNKFCVHNCGNGYWGWAQVLGYTIFGNKEI